jgi:hypothetical protein
MTGTQGVPVLPRGCQMQKYRPIDAAPEPAAESAIQIQATPLQSPLPRVLANPLLKRDPVLWEQPGAVIHNASV